MTPKPRLAEVWHPSSTRSSICAKSVLGMWRIGWPARDFWMTGTNGRRSGRKRSLSRPNSGTAIANHDVEPPPVSSGSLWKRLTDRLSPNASSRTSPITRYWAKSTSNVFGGCSTSRRLVRTWPCSDVTTSCFFGRLGSARCLSEMKPTTTSPQCSRRTRSAVPLGVPWSHCSTECL